MHNRRWTPPLLVMVLYAIQLSASNAESPTIGVAASIKPNAEGGLGTNLRALSPGSHLHARDTVRTGNLGQAVLVFIDNTNLTVGPKSEVLLDEFGPTGSFGRVVMQATRGEFRLVAGRQQRTYRLNTRYGTAAFVQSYDPANGTDKTLSFASAPTDQDGKNAYPRSFGNDAYAQAVGRGAGSVINLEVVSEEEKRRGRYKCDVRVKVEGGEAEFTTPDKKLHKVKAGQSICVKDGVVTYSSAQAEPPTMPSNNSPVTPCVSPTKPDGTC